MGTMNSWTTDGFSMGFPNIFGYQLASFGLPSASQQHIHDSRQCRDASCVHLVLPRLSHLGSISDQDTWRSSCLGSEDPNHPYAKSTFTGIETHWGEIYVRNSSINRHQVIQNIYSSNVSSLSFYRHALDSNNSSKRQRSARTLDTQILANPPVPTQSVASRCGRKQDVAASAPVRDQTETSRQQININLNREKTTWSLEQTPEQDVKSGSLEALPRLVHVQLSNWHPGKSMWHVGWWRLPAFL